MIAKPAVARRPCALKKANRDIRVTYGSAG
jgi:hypothetical protein